MSIFLVFPGHKWAKTIHNKKSKGIAMSLSFDRSAALIAEAASHVAGAAAQITGAAGQLRNERIPFLVEGTTSNPQFIPDLSGVALHMLQGQLGGLVLPH